MHLIQAVLMGIVQGLSEFLPISSSAHIIFASNFYKVFKGIEITQSSNQEIFLDIMLHVGTLVAVLIYFRKELWDVIQALIDGFRTKKYDSEGFKTGLYIILGTIITVLVAYPLSGLAAKFVFMPQVVALFLFLTGLILLLAEFWAKKQVKKVPITLKNSVLMAIAQGLAALPGFSRSGLTIATGLMAGNDRTSAAKYSFLLSIPIIMGSSMFYPLFAIDLKEVVTYNWSAIVVGTVVSGMVGYLCIKYFMRFLSKFSLTVFGYYCIVMGIFAFIFFRVLG